MSKPVDSKDLTIKFDGACFGNPGPMGIGVVILDKGKVIKEISEAIGRGTNNIAEYSAALRGLEEASNLGAAEVAIQGDSQLIIKQLNGEWKIKDEKLKLLYTKIQELQKKLKVTYKWVEREHNMQADELSKKALTNL